MVQIVGKDTVVLENEIEFTLRFARNPGLKRPD